MFEKIDVKELVRRLSMPSDEKEIEAQESAEGVITVAGKALHHAVSLVSQWSDSPNMVVENNSLTFFGVDPTHVSMFAITVGSNEHPETNPEEKTTMVEIRRLKELSMNHKKHNKKHTDMITLTESDEDYTVTTQATTMQIRKLDSHYPKLPDLDSPYRIEASYKDFSLGIKAGGMVGDLLTFNGLQDHLVISSKGSVDSTIARVDGSVLKHADDVTSQYSHTYLKALAKFPKNYVETINVAFGENYPSSIQWTGTIAETPIHGTFLIAPRVQQD